MFPSQVKDSDLVEHFNVTIEDTLYAIDEKGHRKFLTDLRVLFARSKTNEINQKKKQQENKIEKALLKQQLSEVAQELFVELDRSLPEYEVIMRNSQAGLDLKEIGLKIYCIASLNGKHVVSCTSKIHDREFLEESFSDEKFYVKHTSKSITIPTNDFEHLLRTIKRMIMIHQ